MPLGWLKKKVTNGLHPKKKIKTKGSCKMGKYNNMPADKFAQNLKNFPEKRKISRKQKFDSYILKWP